MSISIGNIVGIILVAWIVYSIAVLIYIGILSHRYLTFTPRDTIIGNNKLRGYREVAAKYEKRQAVNVLVLSGGGLRGMIPLHILSYIEQVTGKKTGELFDFFSGSSTGAISAAGLAICDDSGQYKFAAKDILREYKQHSRLIFSSPLYHKLLTMFGLFAPKFTPDNKLKVLDYYLGNTTIGQMGGNILIPVYDVERNKVMIIKNWCGSDHAISPNFLLKDVINGSSSPPMLFPPCVFSIANKPYLFIDPAVIVNDPLLQVILYLRNLLPEAHLNIVAIGNGSSSSTTKYDYRTIFSFGLYGLYQYLVSAPSLSSELYLDSINDYLSDSNTNDHRMQLFTINSVPHSELSIATPNTRNLNEIERFADIMLKRNSDTIDKVIKTITGSH